MTPNRTALILALCLLPCQCCRSAGPPELACDVVSLYQSKVVTAAMNRDATVESGAQLGATVPAYDATIGSVVPEPKNEPSKSQVRAFDFRCPGSPVPIHGSSHLLVKTAANCRAVRSEILARVAGQAVTWLDPHLNGTYSLDQKEASGLSELLEIDRSNLLQSFWPSRMLFTLTDSDTGTCEVGACSETQGPSLQDTSINYCAMRNLFCGSADGCHPVRHDFKHTELKTEGGPDDKAVCMPMSRLGGFYTGKKAGNGMISMVADMVGGFIGKTLVAVGSSNNGRDGFWSTKGRRLNASGTGEGESLSMALDAVYDEKPAKLLQEHNMQLDVAVSAVMGDIRHTHSVNMVKRRERVKYELRQKTDSVDVAGKFADNSIDFVDGSRWTRLDKPYFELQEAEAFLPGYIGGLYKDPNHYKVGTYAGLRMISEDLALVGTDDGVSFYALQGKWVPGTQSKNITVDFSSKGGPAMLNGMFETNKLIWEDGNVWTLQQQTAGAARMAAPLALLLTAFACLRAIAF